MSLGISLKIVTLPLAISATAMRRTSEPGFFVGGSWVLNATRVPSGEIFGQTPKAIFFAPLPSRLATQTLSLRANAIFRCASVANIVSVRQKKRESADSFVQQIRIEQDQVNRAPPA